MEETKTMLIYMVKEVFPTVIEEDTAVALTTVLHQKCIYLSVENPLRKEAFAPFFIEMTLRYVCSIVSTLTINTEERIDSYAAWMSRYLELYGQVYMADSFNDLMYQVTELLVNHSLIEKIDDCLDESSV
ncbi:MAG: hypothetical protein ABI947_30040 [Chloroflexota bacterium]